LRKLRNSTRNTKSKMQKLLRLSKLPMRRLKLKSLPRLMSKLTKQMLKKLRKSSKSRIRFQKLKQNQFRKLPRMMLMRQLRPMHSSKLQKILFRRILSLSQLTTDMFVMHLFKPI